MNIYNKVKVEGLNQVYNRLVEDHQQLRNIIEYLPDAIFAIDRQRKVIAWNRAIEEMTGVEKAAIIGKGNHAYAIPFFGEPRPMLIDQVNLDELKIWIDDKNSQKNGSLLFEEIFLPQLHKSREVSLRVCVMPLVNRQRQIIGAIETLRDITESKKIEAELKYHRLHDHLTAMYNRDYFEEALERLEAVNLLPVGVLVCDIDGLKLVNESLDHKSGDLLIKTAARIIREVSARNTIAARVAGDEFALLLPNNDRCELENIQQQIKNRVAGYNQDHPELPLSISIGWAVRQEAALTLKDIYEQAEDRMYQEKLQRDCSERSAIVQTLVNTLSTRDFITEGHTDRMKEMVIKLSHELGLTERKILDLGLLAQFHDIGKVGIPDNIIFKEGPLNEQERETMRRHSEIGYIIAKSAEELLHISDWILMHHEWWDGSGYPRGLKGEEIPLECRILAIADAYDAMTSDRPYRKAMSHQEAVSELRRCAGTQFDPKLVAEFIKVIEENGPVEKR